MARRTLLLDLDGTLWDSRPWYAKVMAQLSDGSVAQYERTLATGTSIVQLVQQCGVSRSRFARSAKENATSLAFYDGVRQTLDELRERGTSMGVVTNLPGWLVTPMAEATGIDKYFGVIMTPRPGVPAKPQPHGIRKALREMGREPDHTWFVGDGAADAEAAKTAAVSFAWASYGYESTAPSGTEIVLLAFKDVLGL